MSEQLANLMSVKDSAIRWCGEVGTERDGRAQGEGMRGRSGMERRGEEDCEDVDVGKSESEGGLGRRKTG